MRNYTTQMDAAKKGIITPEMKAVAKKEYRTEEEIRELVAKGQVAICANKLHTCIEPNGVGSMLRTKINVNLGVSRDCKDYDVEMQKVMEKIPTSKNLKADKVLEINPNHKLFETLENLYNDNDPSLSDYVKLLYDQALLIEGFPIKDPVEFSKKMCNLMINCKKY